MTDLCKMEVCSGSGNFTGVVSTESAKFDTLPKDIKQEISFDAQKALENIQYKINLEWAKINLQQKRDDAIRKLTELFHKSGFNPIYVEVIDNQYSSNIHYYTDPWLVVTTQKGRITLGWRKRVINIDWSESDIQIDGSALFSGENTTVGKNYVHCWGYDKAVEYLTKLNAEVKI